MAKTEKTVEELVRNIQRGELQLPEMQRRYVWRSTKVRDLLDSLYRGYPSGTILQWETDEDVPLQQFAVEQQINPLQRSLLLLDGQQRLTSLSAVINGEPVSVRGRRRPIELLFNLEHPTDLTVVTEVNEDDDEDLVEDENDSSEDELQERFSKMTFVVATNRLTQLPQWVKVSDVFKSGNDTAFLKRAGVTNFEDERYTKYSQRLTRLRGIRQYVYRIDVLEPDRSYEEVTEIFVRVNSLGAKLRSSDLALAQITAKWRNSLKIFQDFQRACSDRGFEVDFGLHLRNLVAFATGQSRFNTVGNLGLDELQSAWRKSCLGMEFALNFLRANADIESPALLSSPFILITLAYHGHKRGYSLSPEESERMRYWLLVANAKGHYSRGSSETILDQDLAVLEQGGDAQTLVDRLRLQVGRLDIVPGELEGRNQRSALFKTMFLAFRDGNARDWKSTLKIALSHSGTQHRLQFHHIFPKGILRKDYTSRQANDIANLCFISGKTNRQISDKAPAEYFPEIVAGAGESVFLAQCIPTTENLLKTANYMSFLRTRRDLIANRLNAFLGD